VSERSYLEEISIRSLGIIDQSTLELGKGLNVLTGETGAGKTLSAVGVASYIESPRSSGIPYIAPINSSTVAIYNALDLISAP
jgi:recombinational DNA repair ATPase RecF